jgi:HEAT repeat protein
LKAAAVLSGLTLTPAIKEAFITTLLKDDNSAVRIQALEALDSHILEQEVAPVFMNASRKDENEFVRIKASQALQRIEKIE